MKKRLLAFSFFIAMLLIPWQTFSQSVSATYSSGDISTDDNFYELPGTSACPGTLSINVPAGNEVTTVDVVYTMTASGDGWMEEQMSWIYCPTTLTGEASISNGNGEDIGTVSYSRNGLNIAEGATGTVQFQLHAGRAYGGSGCGTDFNKVDNNSWTITVHYAPISSCPKPTNVVVNGITNVNANISWTGSAPDYQVEYGLSPLTQGNGTIVSVSANNTILNGLSASQNYDVYVKAICNGSESSSWSAVKTFRTPCNSINTFPYFEGFESGSISSCWQNESGLFEIGDNSNSGNYCMGVTYDHNGTASIVSPIFDLPSGNKQIEFYWMDNDISTAKVINHDSTFFETSTDLGSTWVKKGYLSATSNMTSYQKETFDLSAYSGSFMFRFRDYSDGSYSAYGTLVDDIQISVVNNNANLSDLKADGITVQGFSSNVYSYNVVLPFGTTTVPTISATAADATASVVVTQAASVTGSATVAVTAQDGSTVLTYTVNFSLAPASTNASLADLKVDGTSVTGFAADVYSYNVVLPYGTTIVPTVSATSADATASVVVTQAASVTGSAIVAVTAQDGSTVLTYSVNFSLASISSNASLADLKVDGTSVTGFAADIYSYNVVLPYGTTVVPTVSATADDATASVIVTQAASVTGSATVAVTAQDGSTVLTYTVNFSLAPASTNASLADLKVDGTTVNGFAANVYSYNVVLPYGTTVVPTVSATSADATASVVVTQAATVTGSATVAVTAQDGSTILTYTVNFSLAPASTNASLADLKVDGTTVNGFAANVYSYNVVLPYGTTVVPTVSATSADATASVVVTQAASVTGSATVAVTAQDGSTVLTYTVNFSLALASTNASLADLKVDGTTVNGFAANVYSYNVVLPFGTTTVPTISATAADATASAVVTQAASVTGSAIVSVTAQDGSTVLTYTVNFSLAPASTNASLADLKVDGTSVSGFATDVYSYNVVLPFGTTIVPTVSATSADATASVVVTQAASVTGSAIVAVTAQDGSTVLTYTVNFSLAPASTNASLADLKVDGTTVNGFAANVYSYNIVLPFGTTTVPTISATAVDATASVVVTQAASVTGSAIVSVTAQDGSTVLTYTVNFSVNVGINEASASSVNVYPNPASEFIYIDLLGLEDGAYDLTILNLQGQVVYSQSLANNGQIITINTSNLSAGNYFLKIGKNHGNEIKHIISIR